MNNIDTKTSHITPAGISVFDDLGLEPQEAAKLKIKAQLMTQIRDWIREHDYKQEEAAEILKITRPRVSEVVNGKISRFTIDALVDMLERAGKHVFVKVA